MDVEQLLEALHGQRQAHRRYIGYYRDGGGRPYMPNNAREEYHALVLEALSNWCGLVIDVVAERLVVDGFRAATEDTANGTYWRWWQANRLDGRQAALYVDALAGGVSYVSVWTPSADTPAREGAPDPAPVIRVESPEHVYAEFDPLEPTTAVAAVKSGAGLVWHYTPEMVRTLEPSAPSAGGKLRTVREIENPLGAVPVIAFRTRADGIGRPASDLEAAIPIQDRITSTTFDRMMAQKYSAFRQRWVTGMAIPTDDTGEPVEPFRAAVDRLWMAEEPDVSFGEFSEGNLGGYIAAVDADIQALASVTRTPPHYLLGKIVNLSADALKAAETGLTAKVQQRQIDYGEAWEQVLTLAAVAADRSELADPGLETIWRNTEARSEAQLVDAALKLDALGVPRVAIWERIGASPQQIEKWTRLRRRQALEAGGLTPLTAAVPASARMAGTEDRPAALEAATTVTEPPSGNGTG